MMDDVKDIGTKVVDDDRSLTTLSNDSVAKGIDELPLEVVLAESVAEECS